MKMIKKSKNALLHGVYTSDVILPWESAKEFYALLKGTRDDLQPDGTVEDQIVKSIAKLYWKKRRVDWFLQMALRQSRFADEAGKSGKRSVDGVCTHLAIERLRLRRKNTKQAAAVAELSEAMTEVAATLNSDDTPPLGKLGANMRYVLGTLDELEPIIAESAKSGSDEPFDVGPSLDVLSKAIEMEAQLDGLIDKAQQRLIIAKEYRKHYTTRPKLLAAPKSKGMAATKRLTKNKDENDNRNENNNDNDNDDDPTNDPNRPESFDWEQEYDEAVKAKEKAARRKEV